MSKDCGSLALTAAIALEADFVFIPEVPPASDWPDVLCSHLQRKRKYDVRVARLGHIQRGGRPSFLDRYLGCRMGFEAINALLRSEPASPKVLCLKGHVIAKVPLSKVISYTRRVREERRKGSYGEAVDIRGGNFRQKTDFVQLIAEPPNFFFGVSKNFGVIHCGSPAAGMNGVTHAFVRIANHSKYNVYGIEGCWEGLMEGKFRELNWGNVAGWMSRGGSELGTKRQLPTDVEKIAEALNDQNIEGLLIVGGFEIIETMGGRCGFLAIMTALATGADKALVFQEDFTEKEIRKIFEDAWFKNERELGHYTIIRSEGANDSTTCEEIRRNFENFSSEKKVIVVD
ncbi:Phosphofructokinase [Necator americanus]|uniref:Phosphofructokinase n=1 Tax=Necator americanus TaxID=51031 RepID=W2TMZ4_NECAM|nr:Phosphofructokinase [Necator americanus]ETN82362.1 Phosphofructokinase [Necator americanus]